MQLVKILGVATLVGVASARSCFRSKCVRAKCKFVVSGRKTWDGDRTDHNNLMKKIAGDPNFKRQLWLNADAAIKKIPLANGEWALLESGWHEPDDHYDGYYADAKVLRANGMLYNEGEPVGFDVPGVDNVHKASLVDCYKEIERNGLTPVYGVCC